MKLIIFIALSFFVTSIIAQNDTVKVKPNTSFTNQGEQEENWGRELFENNYTKQNFKRYQGRLFIGKDVFRYGDHILEVKDTPEELKEIFKLGIIYNAIIGDSMSTVAEAVAKAPLINKSNPIYFLLRIDTLLISDLQELKGLSSSPKIKRFKFLLWRKKWQIRVCIFSNCQMIKQISEPDC